MEMPSLVAFVLALASSSLAVCQECQKIEANQLTADYQQVFELERSGTIQSFVQLPGHTRSRYEHNYGLIPPESRVWAANNAWPGCTSAHLLSARPTANFSMLLVLVRFMAHSNLLVVVCMQHD